ncbi:MAG: hypothetical protein QOD68_285 [Actinomycetota bacterium]|jgi:uncharacterized protein (DUF1697 family)|nr:hypothetical protein [Actinomycetota bacterium]
MRWVAFVRNVMVGRESLHRETLMDLAREAGGTDVLSHMATGNLTFATHDMTPGVLADRLEAGVKRVLGREEMVAIRSMPWLVSVVNSDPFAGLDPAEWGFEVAFLRHDAPPLDASRLSDAQRTVLTRMHDRELFAARPAQGGQRPHVNRLLERATGSRATSRGWSTLQRIVASANGECG